MTLDDRSPAELRAQIGRIETECARLRLENQLLREELLRHGSGMLQIRSVERKLAALAPKPP